MTEKKCKYCKKLLINLIGPFQTCLKSNTMVCMEDVGCIDFEFSQKRYDRITEYESADLND